MWSKITWYHWKQKVVNLTTFPSLVAPQVALMTTYGATSSDKVVKLTIFCFQWLYIRYISTNMNMVLSLLCLMRFGTGNIIHILQGYFTDTGTIMWSPQCQWSNPEGRVNLSHALTHWGWMTHICISKLTLIGSDNGLSTGRCQAIIWTNYGISLTGPEE